MLGSKRTEATGQSKKGIGFAAVTGLERRLVMGKPTQEEFETALTEAARLREHGLDEHFLGKSPLNLNYRMKFMEELRAKANLYLHSGDGAHEHAEMVLAITGFATSIDAMVVEVGLAFLVLDILPIAAAIGFTTFVMVMVGVMVGQVLGVGTGKRTETLGGLLLIGIGTTILIEHLGLV
jgi:hypothetical protein